MNEHLHNIDRLFKNAMEHIDEEPSSNVWESIDKNLDKKKVISISKKYHKLKLAASFLLIFSIGMAMYILQTKRKNQVPLIKNHDSITLNSKVGVIKNDTRKEGVIPEKKSSIQKQIQAGKSIPSYNSAEESSGNSMVKKQNIIKQSIIPTAKDSAGKKMISSVSPDLNSEEKKLDVSRHFINKNDNLINQNDKVENFGKLDSNKAKKTISGKDEQKLNGDTLTKFSVVQNTSVVRLSAPDMIMYKKNFPDALHITNSNAYKYTGAKIKILQPLHESRFNATVFFSPDLVSYNIKSDQPHFEEDEKNQIRKDEKSLLANSFGVLAGYQINRNWMIQSGITISNRITGIDAKTIYARPDRNGDVNFRLSCFTGPSYIPLKSGIHPAAGDSTIVSAKSILRYMSVPIVLQYRVINSGRLSVSPGAGIGINFLLANKIESLISTSNGDQQSVTSTDNLRSAYINSFITLNATYKIGNRIAFTFTPIAQVGLSSVTQSGPVKTMLNSLGFEAGLRVGFKN